MHHFFASDNPWDASGEACILFMHFVFVVFTFPPFDDAVDEDLYFCFFLLCRSSANFRLKSHWKGGSKQSLSEVSQLGWSSEKCS